MPKVKDIVDPERWRVIAIDPGKKGAIVTRAASALEVVKMQDLTEKDLFLYLERQRPYNAIVVMERVWARPGNGVKQSYNYGYNNGMIMMACTAARLKLEMVLPKKWQTALSLDRLPKAQNTYINRKKRNKQHAQRLFPDVEVTHVNADALLLSEYGVNQLVR